MVTYASKTFSTRRLTSLLRQVQDSRSTLIGEEELISLGFD